MCHETEDMPAVERLGEVARLLAEGFLKYRQNRLDMSGNRSVYSDQQNA